MAGSAWDAVDPFVLDADGSVIGLACEPPHHAAWLADGWEGGHNLFPLVADSPAHFTADMLVYTRRRADGTVHTRTASLLDEPPFVYLVSGSNRQP